MATTKTIQPTGETITIPAMADQPDMSVVATDLGNITDAVNAQNQALATLNSNINKIAFANHDSKTTYQIPLTGYSQNNYWVALMYAQTGIQNYGVYLIFMNTSDAVTITKIVGSSTITYTGTRNGNVIDLTASDTVWGGIRVLTMN